MDAHPTRTFILQILKLLVWIVIAVALVKFAFFPNQQSIEEITGEGNFTFPTVSVTRGDLSHEITLDASVVRNESEAVKATTAGKIVWFYAADGAAVNEGDPILQILHTEVPEMDDPEAEPSAPIETYHDVFAPAPGTLSLDALIDQEVEVGMDLGSVLPDTFHAEVPVTPDQLYSLQGIPKEAELAVTGGPAPFTCTGLKTFTGTPSKDDPEGKGAGPQLRCDIPESELVFDGVKAKLIIHGGQTSNALLVPVTAVEGRFKTGNVYLPVDDITQKPEKVEVSLGVSDGYQIEITKGLAEGQEILEYVPRQTDDDQNMDPEMGIGG